jgi:hypothetical protein
LPDDVSKKGFIMIAGCHIFNMRLYRYPTHHILSLDGSHSEKSSLDSHSDRDNSSNDCVPTGTLVNEKESCSIISTILHRIGKFFLENLSNKWHEQQREV